MSREMSHPGLPNYGSTAGSDHHEVLFSGESRELRMLCDSISTNIYSINSSARSLQGALGSLGTARDTPALRDQIHVWQLTATQVMKACSGDVAKLTRLARSSNKQQRLQADKITNHFQEAVAGCTKSQMAVTEKMRKTLPRQASQQEDLGDEAGLIENETRQQLQAQQQIQFENEMLAEREHRISEIESEILGVNQIMKELGALVHQQGEFVDSIENSVESARGNVEAGEEELRAAATLQNRSRRRNLWLLIALVITLTVLIGIIVWSAK